MKNHQIIFNRVKNLANFSDSCFNNFLIDRSKDPVTFKNLEELFIDSTKYCPETNKLGYYNYLTKISSTLSFYKWKNVEDWENTAWDIYTKCIKPLNTWVKINAVFTSNAINNLDNCQSIIYIPNVNPFIITSNANGKGARDIIEAYAIANVERPIMKVYIEESKLALVPKYLSDNDNLLFIGYSMQNLVQIINNDDSNIVIYDYFIYPWTFLPICSPKKKFIYLSMGFNACNFNYNAMQISIIPLNTPKLDKLMTNDDPTWRKRNKFLRRIKPPVHEISQNELPDQAKLIENIFSSNSKKLITLCRHTKLSLDFQTFIKSILDKMPDLVFIGCGPGMENIPPWHERVHLLSTVDPSVVLPLADAYIETFPETQGYSIIEAYQNNLPVLSLGGDYTITNLFERVEKFVFESRNDLINSLHNILYDNKEKNNIIKLQNSKLSEILVGPEQFVVDLLDLIKNVD